LPSAAFADAGLGKLLFRDMARRLLPAELLQRPKTGFGIPINRWLRAELRPLLEDALLGGELVHRRWLRHAVVRRLVAEHTSGFVDHGQQLWSLMCLELWARQFLDTSASALHAEAAAYKPRQPAVS
jgi:asparagine synthase (glutamine-hydrolysing)